MRYRPTDDHREARLACRRDIVAAANKARVDPSLPPYTMRHLQRCVSIVRRRDLVPDSILIGAGFNPKRGA